MNTKQNGLHPLVANRMAFLVIGCLEAAWAPLVPYVKSAFSLDEETLGLLMLCSGLGSICALPVAGWLCMTLGAKQVVYFSGFLMAFALLAISLMVNTWLTAAMLFIFGACTILIDVSANMLIIMIPNIVTTAIGFALVGLGAANLVPQFVSFASGIKGMAVQNIISIVNAIGYSGVLLGPVIIGFVAKQYGLHTSFAAIAVFALVVAVVSATTLKTRD